MREDAGGTQEEPAFAYALEDGTGRAAQPLSAVGPTIILTRGEPVTITIANELRDPTSVHWHGIEPAEVQMGNGESYDFEFTPTRDGDLRLDITAGNGLLLLGVPVAVK